MTSSVAFLPLAAIIQRFEVDGTNIVQGFDTVEDYVRHNAPFFGETIGRVANRLGGAELRNVNGRTYPLAANNGPNTLHGGAAGWGKKVWDGPTPVGVRAAFAGLGPLTEGGETVRFSLVSPDGDEGFPGTVEAAVYYTAGRQTLPSGHTATVLVMDYEAELVDGADETAINMTNHSYFNLSGGATIEGTVVELVTDKYLPVDDGGIPTGGPAPFARAAVAKPFVLGAVEPDIDDCFIVDADPASVPLDTRGEPLVRVVAAHHPQSGIHLEVLTTEPAFQFYTGKYIDVPAVGSQPARGARSGFCVEPSRYVNASNVDAWRSMTLLKRGAGKYGARIVYRAWKEAP